MADKEKVEKVLEKKEIKEEVKEEIKTENKTTDENIQALDSFSDSNSNDDTKTTASDEEEEEVTFASSSKFAAVSNVRKFSKDDDDDYSVADPGRQRISVAQSDKDKNANKKKKIPTPLIAVAAALVVFAVTGGVIAAISSSRNSVQTNADTEDGNSAASETSHLSVPSVPSDEDVAALPVIRQESAQIKEINTSSIVFGEGVTVAGVDLKGKTLSEAYDAMQKRLLELRDNISISITCDGSKNVKLTQDDFKFDTDISNVLIQAYHYSRGELETPTVQVTSVGGATDFTVTSVVNRESIKSAVAAVANKFDIQPVDAHVGKFTPS